MVDLIMVEMIDLVPFISSESVDKFSVVKTHHRFGLVKSCCKN